MSDLTERLRNQNLMWASDRHEAADRIEALTAENERLREALRTLIKAHEVLGFLGAPSVKTWGEARAALEQEV